jgi:hypothetical protein
MIFVGLLFSFVIIPAEDQLLDSLVSTGPDITLDAWRDLFKDWAKLGVVVALFAAFLWYAQGQWFFILNNLTNANKKKRWVWLALLGVALLAAVPGDLLTPRVQEWGRLATVFYVANNFLAYYVVTLVWSPSSFKYMPLGATTLRYW